MKKKTTTKKTAKRKAAKPRPAKADVNVWAKSLIDQITQRTGG